MLGIGFILNPSQGLTLGTIILISFILGLLHGATPDEHTWPITFSYAISSYSSRKGMKAGFMFSSGFTIQRAFLTTLGFLGLAAIYKKYNLDGPIYIVVGIAMLVAGMYILNKRKYIHIPFDSLLKGRSHHSEEAERIRPHEEDEPREVSLKVATLHGLIAGFGFGAYATILTFILAPQVPSLIYAPLPGLFFGIGTMIMQILFGAAFAYLARIKKLSEKDVSYIGRKTGGRTLYYGGMLFALIGVLVVAFPAINSFAISTGNPIPNLDSVGVATILVLLVVGVIGIGSLVKGFIDISKIDATGRAAKRQDSR
ncbi:MAG: hypothetical protein KGI06_04445 [Candidatus Micrarchaeota archaeon]|nr:hypothetical protein [Candidatus Micrarchaeota archaeon]